MIGLRSYPDWPPKTNTPVRRTSRDTDPFGRLRSWSTIEGPVGRVDSQGGCERQEGLAHGADYMQREDSKWHRRSPLLRIPCVAVGSGAENYRPEPVRNKRLHLGIGERIRSQHSEIVCPYRVTLQESYDRAENFSLRADGRAIAARIDARPKEWSYVFS